MDVKIRGDISMPREFFSAIVASFYPKNPAFLRQFCEGYISQISGQKRLKASALLLSERNTKWAKIGCEMAKNRYEIDKLMLPISKQEKGCMSVTDLHPNHICRQSRQYKGFSHFCPFQKVYVGKNALW